MKALVAYASVGSGHETTAAAIAESLALRNIDYQLVDFLKVMPRPIQFVVKDAYLQMIKYIPGLYDLFYNFSKEVNEEEARNLGSIIQVGAYPFIRGLFKEGRYDIVISTMPLVSIALSYAKSRARRNPVLVDVITDFHVLSLFFTPNIDFHTVHHEDMFDYIGEDLLAKERILPLGIPVKRLFAAPTPKEEARQLLALSEEEAVVLIAGGGFGLNKPKDVAMYLSRRTYRKKVTFAAIMGKAFHGREIIDDAETGNRVILQGWTDDMHLYMSAADGMITKAGGATIAEAACIGVPLILFRPLPGQERVNAAFLLSKGAAVQTRDLDELPYLVQGIIFEGVGASLASNLKRLAKPDSSERIVEEALSVLRSRQKGRV
ncbi:hypothetical protein HPY42_00495 [Coprothermobacteraceae bacterium]|nr:hypothetical protein [Coprothermobacteraceae bacterium]